MTVSDYLTLSRILLTPIIIWLMVDHSLSQGIHIAFILYIIAAVTDFLDGFLARTFSNQSDFGALFDPLADKVLVLSVFVIFISWGKIPDWAVAIIVAREIMVTGLRSFAAQKGLSLKADIFGKAKTVSQMVFQILVFIGMLSYYPKMFSKASYDSFLIGLLWLVLILTIGSGMSYFWSNRVIFVSSAKRDNV